MPRLRLLSCAAYALGLLALTSAGDGLCVHAGAQVFPTLAAAQVTVSAPLPGPNDECSGATLVGDGTVFGSLADNTGSNGDETTCANDDNDTIDEWYCYTAVGDGTLTVTTCNPGSDYDTVLSAFDGCPENGGVEIACNDDTGGAPAECGLPRPGGGTIIRLSTISFQVAENQTYYIRVSAFDDDLTEFGGTGNFEMTLTGPTTTGGDECADAVTIREECLTRDLGDNTGSNGDETSCANDDTIDEWLVYTASADGRIRITTCKPGTEFDTTMNVWDDCPENAGSEIVCNDDTRPGGLPECDLSGLNRKSTVEVDVTAGASYFIRIGVFADDFTMQGGFGTNYEIGVEFLCPCDWNGDGNLNDQDFFDWANDYFSQTGPQGGFDFNGDGNENDQDWFDFTNCYFANPGLPGCVDER